MEITPNVLQPTMDDNDHNVFPYCWFSHINIIILFVCVCIPWVRLCKIRQCFSWLDWLSNKLDYVLLICRSIFSTNWKEKKASCSGKWYYVPQYYGCFAYTCAYISIICINMLIETLDKSGIFDENEFVRISLWWIHLQ